MQKFAVKDNMNMMEITVNQNSFIKVILKWTTLFIFLLSCVYIIFSVHQQHLHSLKAESQLINQKSFLVKQLHNEMLLISRAQLELLHASNETQVKKILSRLSTLISAHLVHYYQLKNITDDSETELLNRFKSGFEKWQAFNQDLLSYASSVSDSAFINTLNKVDMAISQLDEDEALLLVSQLEKTDKKIN